MPIRIDGTNTTANPGITGGDADTGLQFGIDEISFVAGGTEKVKVENGALKVTGESSDITDGGVTLDWESASQTGRIFAESSAASQLRFYTTSSAGNRTFKMQIDEIGNVNLSNGGGYGQISGGFGGYSTTSGVTDDFNHADNARSGCGKYLLTGNASNGPGGGTYFHVFNFEYSQKNGSGNLTQIAWAYNNESLRYMRYRYVNTWSSWSAF